MTTESNTIKQKNQYTIREVVLTNSLGQQVDVRKITAEINIYEDILSNTLSGSILLVDAIDLLGKMNIVGQETLQLQYFTNGKDENTSKIDLTFDIYKISTKDRTKDRVATYLLYFCSPEATQNAKYKLSRAYSGVSSDIVGDIFLDRRALNSNKTLVIEETRYNENLVVPNWTPFTTINWLAKRSVSTKSKGATYMFYETTREFRFESLESLYKQEKIDTLLYSPANVNEEAGKKDLEETLRIIDNISFEPAFDVLGGLKDGLYSSRLYTHDIVRKKFQTWDYNYIDSFGEQEHLEQGRSVLTKTKNTPNLICSELTDSNGRRLSDYPDANIDFYPKHRYMFDDIEDNYVEQWKQSRKSQMKQLDSITVTTTVSGNSDYTVGKVVELIVPAPIRPDGNENPLDKVFTGNYLITSIRHILTPDGYRMVLALNSDSRREPIPSDQTGK